ncbi:MAG: FAD-binding protein [Proteobacteria bacterium]|nr:FAD-binding protein [Pseudomonadota bacterium]
MPHWQNWSGRLASKPDQLSFIYSEQQAAALARACTTSGSSLRAVGSGHSHAELVVDGDVIADLQALSGIISADIDSGTVWVGGGTKIFTLGPALHRHGLALPNQGDIDQQSISGVTATGTHGTGASLQNLSSRVIGARIALANGDIVECSAEHNSELWQASRLHLGAFGLITALQLQCVPAYRLAERSWKLPLQELLADLDGLIADNRHCEFFWHPQTDTADLKVINPTSAAPKYPLGSEGERCSWSYEVLPNHRPHLHTEMEYSVAAAQGPACMQAIQSLLNTTFTDVRWPVEYRTLAADDVWLSTAFARDTVTISVHQDVNLPDEDYYRACEEIFLAFDGRPHWGKTNFLDGTQLEAIHAKWQDWWRVRDSVDPSGTFLNPYLQSIRP